jgi:hypothetical protein
MTIYQKLKAIDIADITDAALATNINTVLSFADQESELDESELAQVEKVYNRAVAHIEKNKAKAEEEARKREEAESEEQQELQRQQAAIDEIEKMQFRHTDLLKQVKDNRFQKRQGAFLMLLGRLKKKPLDEAAKQAVIANSEKLAQDIEAHLNEQSEESKKAEEQNKEKEKLAAEEKQKADAIAAQKAAEEEAAKQAAQAKEARSTGNKYLDTIFARG